MELTNKEKKLLGTLRRIGREKGVPTHQLDDVMYGTYDNDKESLVRFLEKVIEELTKVDSGEVSEAVCAMLARKLQEIKNDF